MLVLTAALALAACQAERDSASPSPPIASGDEECLILVWEGQQSPDREYDRAHDKAEGGAISCATGASASQFDAALATIREAAASGDKARILAEVGMPMLYIDSNGDRRVIEADELDAAFDEIFTPEMVALLARIDLDDMTVVPDEGAFFELGALWLTVDPDEKRPRIVTVNSQALGEAAEAARRAAARKQGRTVPIDG